MLSKFLIIDKRSILYLQRNVPPTDLAMFTWLGMYSWLIVRETWRQIFWFSSIEGHTGDIFSVTSWHLGHEIISNFTHCQVFCCNSIFLSATQSSIFWELYCYDSVGLTAQTLSVLYHEVYTPVITSQWHCITWHSNCRLIMIWIMTEHKHANTMIGISVYYRNQSHITWYNKDRDKEAIQVWTPELKVTVYIHNLWDRVCSCHIESRVQLQYCVRSSDWMQYICHIGKRPQCYVRGHSSHVTL